MANDYFQFRQFSVRQSQCAMKVGTDGTLLGAWAQATGGPCRILDIGTGTGLIALMMAQRYPEAMVVGIDIDKDAVEQATMNVKESPFAERIRIVHGDVNNMMLEYPFDTIVSNPPYFMSQSSMKSPNLSRCMARQTSTLDFCKLVKAGCRMMKPEGILSVVIPIEGYGHMAHEALLSGFYASRICRIRTTPNKVAKRILIEFRQSPKFETDTDEEILEIEPGVRSQWYQELTQAFYIK